MFILNYDSSKRALRVFQKGEEIADAFLHLPMRIPEGKHA